MVILVMRMFALNGLLLRDYQRLKGSLLLCFWNGDEQGKRNERRVMDVSKLEDLDRHLFIDDLIRHVEDDNLRLLQKIKNRIDEKVSRFNVLSLLFCSLIQKIAFMFIC